MCFPLIFIFAETFLLSVGVYSSVVEHSNAYREGDIGIWLFLASSGVRKTHVAMRF